VKRDFLTAGGAKRFRKGRKGNHAGGINFAPFAVPLRPLRLNRLLKIQQNNKQLITDF
jgi:hypothetical protein